jgi:succinoglycan biosynthesis protein ExoA
MMDLELSDQCTREQSVAHVEAIVEPAAPFVTIIIPTLNEEKYLELCIRSLLEGAYPRDRLELIIADGGSTDDTRKIAGNLNEEYPFIRILDNPQKIQAAGFNLAMRMCDPRSNIILRCDAHALYPRKFIRRAIDVISQTASDVVVFSDAPQYETCFQRAVAFAQTTPLGVGNSWYRRGKVSRYVDHGKHGCFSRDIVVALGGYDDTFSHAEDVELSLRIRQLGRRIWLDAGLVVGYVPRTSIVALASQYYRYGRGRAQVVLKHKIVPKPRQLAPVALIGGEMIVLVLSPLLPSVWVLLAAYAGGLIACGFYGAVRQRSRCVLMAPAALAVMHHSWGIGFLSRIAEMVVRSIERIVRSRATKSTSQCSPCERGIER